MKSILAAVGASTVGILFFTVTTNAQFPRFTPGDSGYYWRTDIGAAIPNDGHLTEFGGFRSGQDVDYDVGFALDLVGGYAFNPNFATELQLGGTWNYIDSIQGASIDDTFFSSVPILANIVLQYPIPRTIVVPYVGAGVGGAATFFDTDGLYQRTPGGGFVALYGSESDFVFAWQARAGLRFELNDQLSFGLGYRFLYLDSSSYDYDSAYHGGPDFKLGLSEHQSHTVALTFHMKF